MNILRLVSALETSFLARYLPYLLREADQTLSAPFYAALTEQGVARSEWRVLAVLFEFGSLPVVDLATAALSPQPTVTHALRRLEERGFVTRQPGKKDKRQRVITITEQGASLTSNLVDTAKRLEADALADAGDLSGLLEQLQALTQSVRHRLDGANGPSIPSSSPDAKPLGPNGKTIAT